MKQTVEFLGHQLHPSGISPGKIKSAAIEEFATPKNVTEVRQFLGLSNYFRKFVRFYTLLFPNLYDICYEKMLHLNGRKSKKILFLNSRSV